MAWYLPDLESLGRYHWSILQAEYATDIVFRSAEDLAPLYDHLLRTAIHAVKVDDVATFLGHSPTASANVRPAATSPFAGTAFRLEGTRIRHYLGPASIKMYDKHGFILRVETTTNDVTFFRRHRMVEQRDGQQALFEVLCRGEFLIRGFRNRSLRQHLKQSRPSQISRLLKRLRLHGIIKKVGNTYKYYLTQLGRHVAIAGLTLKNMFLVPEFARAAIAY